jgi:hypothetical protein
LQQDSPAKLPHKLPQLLEPEEDALPRVPLDLDRMVSEMERRGLCKPRGKSRLVMLEFETPLRFQLCCLARLTRSLAEWLDDEATMKVLSVPSGDDWRL